MNLIQALEIVNDCARAQKLMGMNAVYPYNQDQFVGALLALREQIEVFRVQIKTLEAQLRAANARAAKLGKADA